MSYRVTRRADGQPMITLDGEPPFCRALEAAPSRREPELAQGVWLVMAFAVWSVPDIVAIQTALAVAKHFRGRLHLGLRPFDSADEHAAWCPGLEDEENSPQWVLLCAGAVGMTRTGFPTVEALVAAIEAACPV